MRRPRSNLDTYERAVLIIPASCSWLRRRSFRRTRVAAPMRFARGSVEGAVTEGENEGIGGSKPNLFRGRISPFSDIDKPECVE